jgi:hypothetical protein
MLHRITRKNGKLLKKIKISKNKHQVMTKGLIYRIFFKKASKKL